MVITLFPTGVWNPTAKGGRGSGGIVPSSYKYQKKLFFQKKFLKKISKKFLISSSLILILTTIRISDKYFP
jgi:hypothetical protein